MVLILREPLLGASSWWLCSGTLGWVEFVPYFSISAWSRTEDCGPCLSVRRPMRHENLVVRLVFNKYYLPVAGGVNSW